MGGWRTSDGPSRSPWYSLAEIKTPGFLEYFLVGEHWKRFLEPGWGGDLYGLAHLEPRGRIWLYWLACALPWSLVLPLTLVRKRSRKAFCNFFSGPDEWLLDLVFWALAPMVFFTVARNVLPAYVLPGLPAFALLTAHAALLFAKGKPGAAADLLGPEGSQRSTKLSIRERASHEVAVHPGSVIWTASFTLLLFTLAALVRRISVAFDTKEAE